MRDRNFGAVSDPGSVAQEGGERASSLGAAEGDTFEDEPGLRGSSSSAGAGPPAVNGGVKASRISRKGRSKSSSRSEDRPRRSKYLDSASASLSSIPNRIQLSMLSSGLIKISEYTHEWDSWMC